MGEHKIKTKSQAATPAHQRCRLALLEAIRKEAGDMPAEEVLAIVAYTVGQLIALQDQRRITPATAIQLVTENIEQGNRDAMIEAMSNPGKHS